MRKAKIVRYILAWLCVAVIHLTLSGSSLGPAVKRGQQTVLEKNLPLVCLTFATSPGAPDLSSVTLVNTDTKEEFVADFSTLFAPRPSLFTKEEEPRRALSMLVVHLNAGHYKLIEVQLAGHRSATFAFDLTTPLEYFFNVKAGCVNYAGTLVLSVNWQSLPAAWSGRMPAVFIIEDTVAHDKAWAEGEVPGLALMESVASQLASEKESVAAEVKRESRSAPSGVEGKRRFPSAETSFPVNRLTKLVITSPIKFLMPPKSFTAEPGTFEAVLEIDERVYFAAPQGLQFGNEAQPNRKAGGIFLPKSNALAMTASFYLGQPPAAELSDGPWRNLFIQEGFGWHLEPPTADRPECPPDWKAIVDDWVGKLEHGKWRLRHCAEPVFRYSQPTGWLVPLLLERTDKVAADEYSRINLLVVISERKICSLMLTSRVLDDGKVKFAVPLPHPIWEAPTK